MSDRIRCFGTGDPLYERYHDEEWGRPVEDHADERLLFERVCLEGFQAGLSWLTVLRKREHFREVFAGFVPAAVAAFGDSDVARLMADPGIIRNRAKILATIGNAQALLRLHERCLRLANIINEYRPAALPTRATNLAEARASTPESVALSKELKRLGFSFVGPNTIYALQQAIGQVDDHLADCWVVTG